MFACVQRCARRFGVTLTAKVLRGANDAKVQQFGFDRLIDYGQMKQMPEKAVVQLIHGLVADGYLRMSDSAYPVVQLTEQVRDVMEGEETRVSQGGAEEPLQSRAAARKVILVAWSGSGADDVGAS